MVIQMEMQMAAEKSWLFQEISHEDYCRMEDCSQAIRRQFRVEEKVYDFSWKDNRDIGVIENGTAALIRIDQDGVATVLEEMGPGGVFGRMLAFSGSAGDSLEVISRKPCEVLFMSFDYIFSPCGNLCACHTQLTQNMLLLMQGKAQALSERVDVLSRRSIREKLLCCFRYLAKHAGGGTFTLPFSLSTMADYIASDRSAMMRELRHIREEGLIQSDGRKYTLGRMD